MLKRLLRKLKEFFFPGGAFLGLSMSNVAGGMAKGEKIGKRSKLARKRRFAENGKKHVR
jgi:hypothetical protein